MPCTEAAESRINKEMYAYKWEFKITIIKVANHTEIHPRENAETVIAKPIAYDEESGKERKTNMYFLVQAMTLREAYAKHCFYYEK
jgi:hypothetical protein